MIADVKVDFQMFKTVLLNVVKKNNKLTNSNEYEILNVLYNEYEPKSNIDIKQLENYKYVFKDYYTDKCISLASFHYDENNQVDLQKIKELEESGRLFNVNALKVFMRQLYFEMRLLGTDNSFLIIVLTKLCNCLGSRYYYDISNLDELLKNALYLYLSANKTHSEINPEWKSIVNSVKGLLRLNNLKFEIQNGSINFLDNYDETIQLMIEERISIIGGVEFLKWFFHKEIKPLYKEEIDRFLIHKNSKQCVSEISDLRIPYNYLIQLAAKNIGASKLVIITNEEMQKKYMEVIKIGMDFLNVLDIQSYSVFGDMLCHYKDIPRKLSENILFEKLFAPVQYSPDFTKKFIKDIYVPFFKEVNSLGYSWQEFIAFSDCFLSEKRSCVSYSFEELLRITKIRRNSLSNILDDFSVDFKDVNKEFKSFLMPTNYRQKPLIKLPNNKYFLFSAYFNGFSFCEVLYSKLQRYFPGRFNRLKGDYIEEMFKKLFSEKGFDFHSGKYQADQNTVLECDMVFESSNDIIFFEIKNQPLPNSFEQGDDVETLYSLGEGMIKAQKQCWKHVFNLQTKGQINIEEDNHKQYTLKQKGRRIICISVCSQEYLFLTNKLFSQIFMESLLKATYHAKDPQKEHRLNKLNSLRDNIIEVITDIYGSSIPKHVFHNTLFRSIQQIYSAINLSNSIEDFQKFLSSAICCIDGSGDVYCQLLNCLKMNSIDKT